MADVTIKVPAGRSVKRVNYRKPSSVVELHVNKADSLEVVVNNPLPPGASPDGTLIPPATRIVDSQGAVWSFGTTGYMEGHGWPILKNGVQFVGGLAVLLLWDSQTGLYAKRADGEILDHTDEGFIYRYHGSGYPAILDTNLPTLPPPATIVRPYTVNGTSYQTMQAAFNAATPGSVVTVAGTIIGDAAVMTLPNVTLRGPAIFDAAGASAQGKALIVVQAPGFTVDDIDASKISVSDGNGAFLRIESPGVHTLNRCYVHDSQQGIMTGANINTEVVLNDCIFERNGDGSGSTHNIYIGRIGKLTVNGGRYLDANVGHCIKSRAAVSIIKGATIFEGRASRALDFPDGGVVDISDCGIVQTQDTNNSDIIGYGQEGKVWQKNEFYFRASNRVCNTRQPSGTLFNFAYEPDVKVIENFTTVDDPMIILHGGSGNAYPTWRQGQAVNGWREMSGSSMSANPPTVNPGGSNGFPSILQHWNGLSIDTRTSTLYSQAAGGHTNFYGNQVMRCRTSVDSPAWEEALASNVSGDITTPNNNGYYTPAGRPASRHTYYAQMFIEARNRAMMFGANAVATSGNPFGDVDGFDSTLANGVDGWDARDTYPDLPDTSQPFTGVCKDANENVYALTGNSTVHKWTQASNTWSQVNVGFPPVSVALYALAYDTARDRIGALGDGDEFYTFSISTGTYTARTITGTGATALGATGVNKGMVYVPSLDSYLVRAGAAGGQVFKINANTFDCVELSTTGGGSVPVTTGIGGENVFQKWLYAPQFGVILYVPDYTSNVWAFRVE